MKIKTFIIDAFTNEPFKGNPAGVCLLENDIEPALMQAIASELNLSETAFLKQDGVNEEHFSIRYFTPAVEIAFCGHATLASAKFVLHRIGRNKVSFTTHHNLELSATSTGEDITMKFPLYDTIDYTPNAKTLEAFGIKKPLAARFSRDLDMLLIEVENKEALVNITPDFRLAVASSDSIKELVVTAKSTDKDYDFYSRCFCPWLGIDEDPVTGAVHTALAKYWGDILGKKEMMAYQASKRGGFMKLNILNDSMLEVTSNARIVFAGELEV